MSPVNRWERVRRAKNSRIEPPIEIQQRCALAVERTARLLQRRAGAYEQESECRKQPSPARVDRRRRTAVVDQAEVVIEPGERLLVAGDSGSGKSTLVRAISGLWPWGSGRIDIHPDRRLFMLPQRPYVPAGTLRRATAYPGAADDWTAEQIKEALDKVGLSHLKDKIEDEEKPWDQTLSGGEKQRLAFARLFLHNPDIVVLDEATSALDAKSQDKMMESLIKELPDATLVSVAHRAELEDFHSRKIVLARRKGGAKLVRDIDLVPRKSKGRSLARWLRRAWQSRHEAIGSDIQPFQIGRPA